MTPGHHPDDGLLMDYAFGSMREPMALAIATHLAFCPACRDVVAQLEGAAGAILEDTEELPLSDGALNRALEGLDASADTAADLRAPQRPAVPDLRMPSPLRRYLDAPLDALPWRRRGRAFFEHRLLPEFTGFNVKLLRIPAGHGAPLHSHDGTELTVVLSGGFSDATGHYLTGDLAQADSELVHRPLADDDGDCICLAVTDANIHLAGPIGRLLDPFVRY